MSGGLQDQQTHDIHHRRHDFSFNEEIPSRDPPPGVRDLYTVDPYSRSIEAPIIFSAAVNSEPEKLSNHLPPLGLKQVGDLVEIFNHQRGAFLSLSSSPII